ncbi:uncharacterized protein LOC113557468 [Rhopalosiphum maidis]|uniref:uncharacterized protein LOC113557468 n=1 Tax=Rhopalosiphum maidis TaxID=43146 RepID=UPI000EFDF005|nr:uncharacterized protein LOC113557468 [Rhopalosiphum maidis]
MTCLPRKTKSMIIYLLIGCLFQMGIIHTTPVPQPQSVTGSTASDTISKVTNQTNSMIDDEQNYAIDGVEDVTEVFKSLIKNTGSTVSILSNETSESLKEVAQAGGRATLALGYLCNQLFNGLSATVATSGGYLATGVRTIDDVVGDWPIVGTVTGTLDAVTTQLANTFNEMSVNGRKSREKMFERLRKRLNRKSGRLPATGDGDISMSNTSNSAPVNAAGTT